MIEKKEKLSEINQEKTVNIVEISTASENKDELEMIGFVPGTKTQVCQKSPFSGPLSVTLRGTKIALRRQDAECIYVQYA